LKITFAGVDETYSIDSILQVQDKYPEVEFAILLSYSNSGIKLRYPSINYMLHLINNPSFTNFSIHLCGAIPNFYVDYLKNGYWGTYTQFKEIIQRSPRLQINKKDKELHQTLYDLRKNVQVIQPVNSFEERINDKVDLLWDKSGGNGIFNANWPEPLEFQTCMYAGGISPNNIKEVKEITTTLLNKTPNANIRLDMESGIRDSNNKVDGEAILFICKEIYGY
jgi:hypothetical protein